METFWASLDSFEKVLWGIAIPATLIFAFQTIMTFFGAEADDPIGGGDIDVTDGFDAMHPFTFRNFVNFMLGFSWMGISLYGQIESVGLIVFLSCLGGLFLVVMVMLIFYFVSKLEATGNIEIEHTIGHTATVYIPILHGKQGQIQVNVHGSVREYTAISKEGNLRTGDLVRIVEVIDKRIVCVEKIMD